MFEWEDQETFSFEDSDRFEEGSLCSYFSEPESVVNNWRGWRKQSSITGRTNVSKALDKDAFILKQVRKAREERAGAGQGSK